MRAGKESAESVVVEKRGNARGSIRSGEQVRDCILISDGDSGRGYDGAALIGHRASDGTEGGLRSRSRERASQEDKTRQPTADSLLHDVPLMIAISPIMGDDRTHVNAKQILWAATLGGEPACP